MLVFYGSSTLLRSFRAQSVNLSTLFPGKPPRQFTSIVSAHSFASNWQLPILNRRTEGDNGRRIFIMTSLLQRICAGREGGIRDRPHTRRTRVRPSYHARQKKKNYSRRVVHAAERLALLRSVSSVRYSLEAIVKSLTNGVSLYKIIHYNPAIVLIGLKYYSKEL